MTDDQAEIDSMPTDGVPTPDSPTNEISAPVIEPTSEPSVEPVPSPIPTAPEPPAPASVPEPPQPEPALEPTPPLSAPSVPEQLPEPKSEPTPSSPTPAPEPEKPKTTPPSTPEHHVEPKASVVPQKESVKPASAPVFDVNQLSDEQLKAAAALFAKKNQKALSRKGVEARQALAHKNITAILDFMSHNSPANNRTIARALNLPPRRVQHYMQQLTHGGEVIASGWGISREYRIKK